MLSLRVAPLPSVSGHYHCVGCTAASVQPGTVRFVSFSFPRLVRFVHRRQRRVAKSLYPSASAATDSGLVAHSNTLLLKYRSLVLGPSRVQAVLWFCPSSGLTLPLSGPAFGGPLKSNVSAQARSMNRSVIRAFAPGRVAFERLKQLSLRRLHSGIGAARHGVLRSAQLALAVAFRAPASWASKRVSLAERFRTDRQLSRSPEQYTSGLVPLAFAQSQWRSRRVHFLVIGRANLSFKRTRLRRSA